MSITRHQSFEIRDQLPTIAQYQELRRTTDWPPVSDALVEISLRGTMQAVVALSPSGTLLGMGRAVGDRAMYCYLQDVVVRPEARGLGVGRAIVGRLVRLIRMANEDVFVGLMAARGSVAFYERLGFARRPPARPGMFLKRSIALAPTGREV